MDVDPIPFFPDIPFFDENAIDEMTRINFGTPMPPESCDVIFVFGGTHPGLWETGAQAYARGLGLDVVVTGGYKPTARHHGTWQHGKTPEAEVIRQELINRGVPPERIYAETKSTNTYENVVFAKEVFDFSKTNRILAVCKSFAVGRQCRTLQAQIPDHIQIIPYPFNSNLGGTGPVISRKNWMTMPESRSAMFGQTLKIIKYGSWGHLTPLTSISDPLRAMVCTYLGIASEDFSLTANNG